MSNIKNIPSGERPYEKMLMYGEKALSNVELLSIIIKTGTKDESAIEIAEKVISKNLEKANSLRFLQTVSVQELMQIDGIGKVKAIELKAVGEIAKRISKPLVSEEIKIKCAEDVAILFMEELQNEKNEILKIIILDNKNIIKKILTIAVGNEKNITANIKQILSEPVKMQAPKIILIHNHPSGDPKPSNLDIEFTKRLAESAKLLDIDLLDHIIIGDGIYQTII
jgi:DNA repair protein RadC